MFKNVAFCICVVNPTKMARSVSDWIYPCYAQMGPDEDNHPYESPTRFPSTMAAYIQYIKQFKELRRHGGFKAVVGVHFEDMILTPGKTMRHIAKHFDGVVVPPRPDRRNGGSSKESWSLSWLQRVSREIAHKVLLELLWR